MTTYSTKEQLASIAHYLTAYMKIPFFQDDTIPGKIMEKILSLVHGGKQLGTYDYVDVYINGKIGWQVKSTKSKTPMTWNRAKIANSKELIIESENGEDGANKLGSAIIDFCNQHVKESLEKFNLEEIVLSRLIMFDDNTAIYYERLLSTQKNPEIFDKDDYVWSWSKPKKVVKKEQLHALHGIHKKTGHKNFSWHGKGENQLHFSGEKNWWPEITRPTKIGDICYSSDGHAISFKLPTEKVSWDDMVCFLNEAN
jgi:hypothetical protein